MNHEDDRPSSPTPMTLKHAPISQPALSTEDPRRWAQLVAVGLIIVATQALPTYGGAILIPQMAKGLAFSRTQVGAIFSSFMISIGVLSFVSGALINRFGPRAAFALGTAMLAAGSALISVLQLSWTGAALVIGVLVGGATAIGGSLPAVTHIARWFTRRRAMAMTFIFCMMSLGGALGVGLLNVVDGPQQDWRAGWRVVAMCAVGALVLVLAVIRERSGVGGTGPAPSGSTKDETQTDGVRWSAREAVRSRLFPVLMLASTGAFVATGLLTGHGLLNLLDLGLSSARAASVIAAFPLAALAGKVMIGFIGDRLDPRILAGAATLSCGLGLIAMPFSSVFGVALLSAILIGVGFGGSIVCTPLVLINTFGRCPLTTLTSSIQGVQTITGAAVTLLTGFVYDHGGGYAPLFTTCGGVCCLAGLALVLVGPAALTASARMSPS